MSETSQSQRMSKQELKGRLEAVLFAAGDPVSIREAAQLLDVVPDAVEMLLEELALDQAGPERGLRILRLEDRLQLATKVEYSASVLRLAQVNERQTLSRGALECLAIIAYKQPVTRVEIDEIRGVSSDYVLNKLLERSFITVVGRRNVPGKPKLYATTDEFLRQFGFANVRVFTEDEAFQLMMQRVGDTPREEIEILTDLDDEEDATQLSVWSQGTL